MCELCGSMYITTQRFMDGHKEVECLSCGHEWDILPDIEELSKDQIYQILRDGWNEETGSYDL